MTPLNEISKRIDEAKILLSRIQDTHTGANVEHDRVRNHIAVTDLELKIHQIDSMDNLSKTIQDGIVACGVSAKSQEGQTKSLIFWTKIMAIAIIVQIFVLAFQALSAFILR